MTFDPYLACPCGSGKKLKFCCSQLAGEMDKISRMLDGDQRAACLQHIKSIQRKHADQPLLMALRGMLETELGQLDDARETITAFLDRYPDNPVALAEQATLVALTEDAADAVAPLQRALAHIHNEVPEQVFEAIGAVGAALLSQGDILAAMAHLSLQAHMAGEEDSRALELLLETRSNARLPLLLRDDRTLSACPGDAPWQPSFDAARRDGLRGSWQLAAEKFAALVEPSGQAPEVWRNLALVRSCLADTDRAIDAWRHFASLDVPLDDAVEAEALALLLDPDKSLDRIDLVQVTYPVRQLEALEVALTSDPRTVRIDTEGLAAAEDDGPPPRCAFRLLDRTVPDTGAGLAADAVPETAAYASVFGTETDRPARLELVAVGDDRLTKAKAALAEVGSEMLAGPGAEQVLSQLPRTSSLLAPGWVYPADTPPPDRLALGVEKQRQVIRNTWLHLPMKALDGQTPAEAARDANMRIRTLAAILLLETMTERAGSNGLNHLREELGLPVGERIDPTGLDVREIPLVRLSRVLPDRLADEPLVALWRTAVVAQVAAAATLLAREIVGRESLQKTQYRASALGMLADVEVDTTERLALIEAAREAAEERGDSSAPSDLRELVVRIQRGERDEVQRLLSHITSVHASEAGVKQKLLEILVGAGLIQPDGRPTGLTAPPRSDIIVPGTAGSRPGGIWTPDQAGGPPQGAKRPAIWTPDTE